jgi:Formate/nitrite family of transporters
MEIFLTGIPAGLILAAMVWMLPSARNHSSFIIIIMTYIIAIGGFAHVIAGSTEAFLLLLTNNTSLSVCFNYILFAALGNIIGGSVLFSLLTYAQIRHEI